MVVELARKTVSAFIEDDCPTKAASLSYYTLFSLPPLLLVLVSTLSWVTGDPEVRYRIQEQFRDVAGQRVAEQIGAMLLVVRTSPFGGGFTALFSLAALLLGATSAFVQLQSALNLAWGVPETSQRGEVMKFLAKRVLSLGLILGLAFLLLVWLSLQVLLAGLSAMVVAYLPVWTSSPLIAALQVVMSVLLYSCISMVILRYLPDTRVEWADVALGGAFTGILFALGEWAIAFYLSRTDITDVFGATSSLAFLLVWTYYSYNILLLGAEFTQAWAERRRRPEPAPPTRPVPRGEFQARQILTSRTVNPSMLYRHPLGRPAGRS